MTKPTIRQLEDILSEPDGARTIMINADGSIYAAPNAIAK